MIKKLLCDGKIPWMLKGAFVPEECLHSSYIAIGRSTHFLAFALQELGMILVIGTPFEGSKLSPSSAQHNRNYL